MRPNRSGIAISDFAVTAARADWRELLRLLTGIDVSRCPACGSSNISKHALDADARAPPAAA